MRLAAIERDQQDDEDAERRLDRRGGEPEADQERVDLGQHQGAGDGPALPPIETRRVTVSGAEPVGNPAVHSSTAPCTAVPMPRVTISGWILSVEDSAPLAAPMTSARPATMAETATKSMPDPN